MFLEELEFTAFERKNIEAVKALVKEMNLRDKLEISISDQAFEYILSKPHMKENIVLAYYNEVLIAFAACIKNSKDGSEANFEFIVHPDYRNMGLGKKLYSLILEKAKHCEVKTATAFAKENMEVAVKFLTDRNFKVYKYMWKMDCQLQDGVQRKMPEGEYTIRRLEKEDLSNYVDIMNAGFKKAGDVLYNENSFESLIVNPDEYVFFVEQQGRIAATAAIGMQKDISRGYIHNVTVYQDFRGQGFGTVTLSHCMNKIIEEGLAKASLNVDGENKNALRLYQKAGFTEVDTDIMFTLKI